MPTPGAKGRLGTEPRWGSCSRPPLESALGPTPGVGGAPGRRAPQAGAPGCVQALATGPAAAPDPGLTSRRPRPHGTVEMWEAPDGPRCGQEGPGSAEGQ